MATTSTWTDDRTDTLTRLWREGLSASQIARALGGVTRNAVIGKVHRLGLSGRAKPPRPGARVARPRPVRRRRPASRPIPGPTPVAPEAEPQTGLADVAGVGAHACRWPIGDPKAPGFALCGRPAVRGAYCAAHGARAYRPVAADHLLRLAGLV